MLRVTMVAERNSGLSTSNSRMYGYLKIAFKLFVSSRNSYTVECLALVTYSSCGLSCFFTLKENEIAFQPFHPVTHAVLNTLVIM